MDLPERIWVWRCGIQPPDGHAGLWNTNVGRSVTAQAYVPATTLEAVTAERDALREALDDMQRSACEVLNQWGDPFEPEEQWEAFVANAMRQLGGSVNKAYAALRTEGVK